MGGLAQLCPGIGSFRCPSASPAKPPRVAQLASTRSARPHSHAAPCSAPLRGAGKSCTACPHARSTLRLEQNRPLRTRRNREELRLLPPCARRPPPPLTEPCSPRTRQKQRQQGVRNPTSSLSLNNGPYSSHHCSRISQDRILSQGLVKRLK